MQYHNDKPTTISIKMDKLWKQKLDFVYACTKPQQHWTTAETKSQQEINQLIIYIYKYIKTKEKELLNNITLNKKSGFQSDSYGTTNVNSYFFSDEVQNMVMPLYNKYQMKETNIV